MNIFTADSMNYYPNRKNHAPPSSVSDGAYANYKAKVEGVQDRIHGPKFKEHYNQATLSVMFP